MAFYSHGDHVPRRARNFALFSIGLLVACRSAPNPRTSGCGGPSEAIPPGRHSLRSSQSIDSASAQLGLARLVFHVRSSGPTNSGAPISATVAVGDSLFRYTERFSRQSDSTGIVVVDSLSMRSVGVRVSALGYAVHTFPFSVRPGHTDTLDVTLPAVRVCPIDLPRHAFGFRL